jgi:RimJ/RimL family protein N-acetyltransferase
MTQESQAPGTSPGEAPSAVYRIRRYLRKYGLRSGIQRATGAVRQALVLDETHIWYELDLTAERPRVELAPEFSFRRAATAELPLIEALPTVSLVEAERRVAAGNDLWFVMAGEQPAFACWTFPREMPVISAPGGTLMIPDGTVCLEDSVTSPDFRGRRLAPAAWTLLADRMQEKGVRSIITKIGEDNAASRKAILRSGFAEVGSARFRRVAGRRSSSIATSADTSAANSLRSQFS